MAIVGLLFAVYAFLTDRMFRIREVDIQLKDEASYSIIFPKIKQNLDFRLMNLFGDYVWRVDLEKILDVVEKDHRIKEAKVTRRLPDTIQVQIIPHTPVAHILKSNSRQMVPVARGGELLPPVNVEDATDSPILRGQIFLSDAALRLRVSELLMALPEEGPLSQRTVSELSYDKNKGFKLILQPSGAQVWMGFENFNHRLQQAIRVVQYLDSEQLSGRIIDARLAKKVVVKLRNDP